jgi:hypothetical protein
VTHRFTKLGIKQMKIQLVLLLRKQETRLIKSHNKKAY